MTTFKGNFGEPDEPQQQIDITKTSAVKCDKCENPTFKQSLMLRKLSAIVSPTGEETLVPVQVFACEKCGHVNSEFSDVTGVQ